MDDLFPGLDAVTFEPTRAAGLARLDAFKGAMGRKYAERRNYDLGPGDRSNVSVLSPWTRTRTLLEEELARAALDRFALSTAEKFVQEVCWRTYFKGWLQHRPSVWAGYLDELQRDLDGLSGGRASAYQAAVEGRTGIDCFDAWAGELVETGYLHNHARMWFASIWVFTLNLPWTLGADFFLRHLMDGDPASNTCSWRWVCGLHTPGKTYLARRSNISKYTDGRFSPEGLAAEAPALEGANPAPGPLRGGDAPPDGAIGLLLTEDDLHVETLRPPGATVAGVAGAVFARARSPHGAGARAAAFAQGALDDALSRARDLFQAPATALDASNDDAFIDAARAWASALGVDAVATGFAPVGWTAPRLDALREALAGDGVRLLQLQRDWDAAFWPHARKGFFGLKKQIPATLAELGLPV